MKELSTEIGQTMTTREIAELTGKRHADVLRDFRKQCKDLEIGALVYEQVYIAGNGQEQTEYILPVFEACLLITSYSAKQRAPVIKAIFKRFSEAENLISALKDMDLSDLPPDRFVYVAREYFSGRYKIGISKHPEERVEQLNAGNPEELEIVAQWRATGPGYKSKTVALNKAANHHLRSEWFDENLNVN